MTRKHTVEHVINDARRKNFELSSEMAAELLKISPDSKRIAGKIVRWDDVNGELIITDEGPKPQFKPKFPSSKDIGEKIRKEKERLKKEHEQKKENDLPKYK
ncbi:TPA: hypothetical protein ACIVGF_002892 [Salmonella enterica subsp. enterica serovar 16:l,v:-]|nr:hypothetical protein [Salmonella enterica]